MKKEFKSSYSIICRVLAVVLLMSQILVNNAQSIAGAQELTAEFKNRFVYPVAVAYSIDDTVEQLEELLEDEESEELVSPTDEIEDEEELEEEVEDETGTEDETETDEQTEQPEPAEEEPDVPEVSAADLVADEELLLNGPELFDSIDRFEARYGEPVSVSMYEKTYKKGDSSYITVLSNIPNYYLDSRGREHEIDNTLVRKSSFFVRPYFYNAANNYTVKLPEEMTFFDGVDYTAGGVNIELIPLEGDYDKPVVEENAILYNQVFDGVDVQYTALETKVKEHIILNKQIDRDTFTYELSTGNASAELIDGVIAITKHGEDEPYMYITAPEMYDAAGESSTALSLSMDYYLGHYFVTLTVDPDWLNAPERSYPVKIDPSVDITIPSEPNNCLTFLSRYENNQHSAVYMTSGYAYLGKVTARNIGLPQYSFDYGEGQIYYQPNFDFTTIPKEAEIDNAKLHIYQYLEGSKSHVFWCYMLEGPVDAGMTWQQFTSVGAQIAGNPASSRSEIGFHEFRIDDAVNNWVQGLYPNYGLVLKAQDGSLPTAAFYTKDSSSSSGGQGGYDYSLAPFISFEWSVPRPVPVDFPIDGTIVNIHPIIEHDTSGKLNTLATVFDGKAKPSSVVHYYLNDASKNFEDNVLSSFSRIYPNTQPFESAFPAKATKYRSKVSNWQNTVPFIDFELDTNYYLNAQASTNTETGSVNKSDNFVIYKIKRFDTLPKIARYYGVDMNTIAQDNKVSDMLLVENNTLFIRNPQVDEPYSPGELTDDEKKWIDAALMGRGLHCEFGFEPVNLNTGNFLVEHEDYSITDLDGAFSIGRTFNSTGAKYADIFGRGWSFEYSQSLTALENGDIVYVRGDGSALRFEKNGDEYVCPDGYHLSLKRIPIGTKEIIYRAETEGLEEGEEPEEEIVTTTEPYTVYEYEIKDTDNNVYRFNCHGMLTGITNKKGHTVSFEYTDGCILNKMISPAGNTFLFTCDNRGRIVQITVPGGGNIGYTYDDNDNLVSVTDRMGGVIRYEYDDAHRITAWYDQNGTLITRNTYDDNGRVLSQTDGNGKTTTLSYSDGSTTTTDSDGYTTVYTYDDNYRTTSVTYADGSSRTMQYENNELVAETDELGHTTGYEHDAAGNITAITRYDGATAYYTYNSLNKPLTFTDFDGKTESFSYNGAGDLTAHTDSASQTVTYEYDDAHRLTGFTDAKGQHTSMSYNGALVSAVTDPEGNRTSYSYNSDGLLTSASMADGGVLRYMYDGNGRRTGEQSPEGEYTRYVYDSAGNVTAIVDPNGNSSYFTYDALGNILGAVDPVGATLTYSYDGRGNKLSETDADGNRTTYAYDCKSNLVRETDPDGYSTNYSYDRIGNIVATVDGNGNRTSFSYDYRFNVPRSKTDALGNVTSYTYSESGDLTEIKNPDNSVVEYTYDQLDRVTSMVDPVGLQTNYSYDANGNVTKISDNSGRTVHYSYNALDFPTAEIDANGGTTSFSYDERQRIVAITDSLSGITGMSYDKSGRMTSVKDANGNTSTYIYDKNGNVISETDPEGHTSTIDYNKQDRAGVMTDANGSQTQMVYSGGESLKAVNDALGNSVNYSYNGRGLPVAVTDALGNTTTMSYDGNGNITDVVLPDGVKTEYSYDALDRLTEVKEASGLETSYTYSSMGYVLSQTDNAGNSYTYSYDRGGRLLKTVNAAGQTQEYTYDLVGNVTQEKAYDGSVSHYSYDLNNNMVSSVDPEGRETGFTYDKLDRLIKVTDASHREWSYTYDAAGRLTGYTDPSGAQEKYYYNGNNDIVKMTDAAGNSVIYKYDAAGNVISQKDKNGNETLMGYDALNRVINLTTADGSRQEYLYDGNGQLLKQKDGEGNVTAYEYDKVGNVAAVESPNGGRYTYTYDSAYNNTGVTDPLGNVTAMSYDLNGNLVSKTMADGGLYSYTYDNLARIKSVTSPEGESVSFQYDNHNDIISTKDNAGRVESFTYDVMHRLTQSVDAAGNATSYSYDANGNLSNVVSPMGHTVSYAYDELDRIVKTTDAIGRTSSIVYDILGNVSSVTQSGDRTTRFAYDPNGNMLSVTNALGETSTTEYDDMNRVVKETDAAGKSTAYSYNANGQVNKITAANGGKVTLDYDADGNLTAVSDPVERLISYEYDLNDQLVKVSEGDSVTKYQYDSVGNLTSVTNGEGHTTEYAYDLASRLVSTKDPLDEVTSYVYDRSGNLSSIKYADGSTTEYDYDKLDELVSKEYTKPGTPSVVYTYDADGRCVSMEDFSGVNSYEYDALGRIVTVTYSNGETLGYRYDEYGNIAKLIYPDGSSVRYAYDKLGRLITVTDRDGGETKYTYDKSGNLIHTYRPNGTYTDVEYNSVNTVTSVVNYDPDDKVVSKYEYEYDLSGCITKETSVVEGDKTVREFEYDDRSELTTERIKRGLSTKEVTYAYDDNGNRVQVTTKSGSKLHKIDYKYDAADRLVKTKDSEAGDTVYLYDENGNRVSKADSSGVTFTYEYDSENRLRAVRDDGALLMAALYDGNGDRVFAVNRGNREYNEKVSASGENNNTNVTVKPESPVGTENVVESGVPDGTMDIYATEDHLPADPAETIFWYGFGQGLINRFTVTSGYLSAWFNEAWRTISEGFESLTQGLGIAGEKGSEEGRGSSYHNGVVPSQPLLDQLDLYQTTLIPYGFDEKKAEDYNMQLYVNDINKTYTDVIATYGTDGYVDTVYTYGNERIISEQFGNSSYYSYNGRGDVAGMSNVNGMQWLNYSYDAYGNAKASRATDNPYSYNAEAFDPSTGLQYLRARYYDSGVGGFITKDTYTGSTSNPLTLNLYDYTGNNPLNTIDPSGHGWLADRWNDAKNAGKAIANGVSNVCKTVADGAKAVGNFIKDNAVTIVTTVAAVALTVVCPVAAAVIFTTLAVATTAVSTVNNIRTYNQKAKAYDAQNKKLEGNATVQYVNSEPAYLSQGGAGGWQYYNKEQKKVLTFRSEAEYLQYKNNCEGKAQAKKEMAKAIGHDALDALGMIPGYGAIADAANGTWYAAEGEYGKAAMSYASAFIEVGTYAKSAKGVKNADEIVDATTSISKNADDIVDTTKSISKNADDVVDNIGSQKLLGDGGRGNQKLLGDGGLGDQKLLTDGSNSINSKTKTDFYSAPDGTTFKAKNSKVNDKYYDRFEYEYKNPTTIKEKDVVSNWDEYLGSNPTGIDPRNGKQSIDRIWSEDGTKSIRFSDHEAKSLNTTGAHYHKETWTNDYVINEVQNIQR